MRRRWMLALVAGLVGAAVTAGAVMATPGSGFTPVQQFKGVFDEIDAHVLDTPAHQVKIKTHGVSDVYVTRNAISVGGHSGWHTHPGPSLIIVTQGEIMAYEGDDPTCTGTLYTVGDGFVDAGGGHVHLLRNESAAPAETVAIQFLPKDAIRRIDAPDPGVCDF